MIANFSSGVEVISRQISFCFGKLATVFRRAGLGGVVGDKGSAFGRFIYIYC